MTWTSRRPWQLMILPFMSIFLMTMAVMTHASEQIDVTVFTTANSPPTLDHDDVPVTVNQLDDVRRWEEELNRGMPADPMAAEEWAQHRVASQEGQALLANLHFAMTILHQAQGVGIKRLPAVMITDAGNHYVIYGARTLSSALARYHTWREQVICTESGVCETQ